MPARALLRAALAALALVTPRPAAAIEEVTGTRSMAMADSLRAAATGGAGAYLNPSSLTLVRQYAIEALYQHRIGDKANIASLAISDSVTIKLAAALYYVFLDAKPTAAGVEYARRLHEVGLAVAYPFWGRMHLGVNQKFIWGGTTLGEESVDAPEGYYTLDIGVTASIVPGLTASVVGQNLRYLDSPELPTRLGIAAAYSFASNRALIAFDATLDFTSFEKVQPAFHAGGEYFLAGKVPLRVGFVRDQGTATSAVTAGVGFMGKRFGADMAVRQQVQGGGLTSLAFSLKVFLP